MLRRWIGELSRHLSLPDPFEESAEYAPPGGRPAPGATRSESKPVSAEEIEKAFASLLHRAAARCRVVVLLDALNQFETTTRARYLTWLPKSWPANARLLATAIPCQATATLKERPGCRELAMPPVSTGEAREIARRFYRQRHHRDVNRRVLDALLEKRRPDGVPAHNNPLWLALALQEMNLLEADDFERAERAYPGLSGTERIQALQLSEAERLPADVPGMYDELLDRAGRCFGTSWTETLIAPIALGRSGWRESDLCALVPAVSGQAWDDLVFAGIRRVLGTHLVQRGAQAQWDFFHGSLGEAARPVGFLL